MGDEPIMDLSDAEEPTKTVAKRLEVRLVDSVMLQLAFHRGTVAYRSGRTWRGFALAVIAMLLSIIAENYLSSPALRPNGRGRYVARYARHIALTTRNFTVVFVGGVITRIVSNALAQSTDEVSYVIEIMSIIAIAALVPFAFGGDDDDNHAARTV